MIYWGINALNHGSSIAVFKDNELISNFAAADDTPPLDLIQGSLSHGKPDKIFWYENPWLKKARQVYAGQYKTAINMSVLPSRKLKEWQLSYAPLTYTPHHASHAAAGYFTSPFNHAAVVVIDAIGEFDCATIWEGHRDKIKKVWSRKYPNSLGLFYSAFTKLVGLEPIKQEHLLQQMSQQGDAKRYRKEVESYIKNVLNLTRNLHRGVQDWPYEINCLQDQCDIAAAVQEVFEEQVAKIMSTARYLTGSRNLVYMGGCAMNSQANQKFIDNWDCSWSLPNPGDPSSSIGAVLYHTRQRLWDNHWDPVKHIEIKV